MSPSGRWISGFGALQRGLGDSRVGFCAALVYALALSSSAAADSRTNAAAPLTDDPVVQAMQVELQRSQEELKRPGRETPYFVGYWVVDYQQLSVSASLGQLVSDHLDAGRRIRVELRVGDRQLDNSNYVGAGDDGFRSVGDDLELAPQAAGLPLRRAFWLTSDQAYRRANELLDQKKTQRASEIEVDQRAPDFSVEKAISINVQGEHALPDKSEVKQAVERASQVFVDFPDVFQSEVSAEAWVVRRYFVSSEGVRSFEPSSFLRFIVAGDTQAPDGMPLSHVETRFGMQSAQQLPQIAKRLAEELTQLRTAELVEDYSGPVLFEGLAGAQIAQELLAASLSGTPGQDSQDSPLARRIGKRVLPKNFNVYDDPTVQSVFGLPLVGHYAFDDEGVPAARVDLVEAGRLRQLLMSRTPRKEILHSNGHGRSGLSGWARGAVGNLVLESKGGESDAALRRRLLRLVREEGADYGLIVKRMDIRGFATSGMVPPQPQRVFKLFPDGKEVLVRGASFGEMSVRDLRDIVAAGKQPNVFNYAVIWSNGMWSPSSVVAPSLLFEEVDVNRPKAGHARPPALPRPPLK